LLLLLRLASCFITGSEQMNNRTSTFFAGLFGAVFVLSIIGRVE